LFDKSFCNSSAFSVFKTVPRFQFLKTEKGKQLFLTFIPVFSLTKHRNQFLMAIS